MLVHKGGQINNVQLITGLRIAEMSQLQNCSVMCTKNGSYCENEKKKRERKSQGGGGCVQRMEVIVKMKKKKKRERKSQGGGGCVQRMEVIVKRKKSPGGEGGGQGVYVNGEVKLLRKLKKKNIFFFLGGGGSGLGGGIRMDVN